MYMFIFFLSYETH